MIICNRSILYTHTHSYPFVFLNFWGVRSLVACVYSQCWVMGEGWGGFVTVVKYMDTTGCWPFPNKFKDEYIIYITQDLPVPHMSTARAVGFLLRLLCCYLTWILHVSVCSKLFTFWLLEIEKDLISLLFVMHLSGLSWAIAKSSHDDESISNNKGNNSMQLDAAVGSGRTLQFIQYI